MAWFHFTNGEPTYLPSGLVKASGTYGWLGVDVFFVISGFIIPYAMHRAGYTLRAFPLFMGKRLLRLHPPYLAAIALAILLNFLSNLAPGFRGPPFSFSWGQLCTHFFYVNRIVGLYHTLNPVFWSLAIEIQWYLLVAAVYGLLVHPRAWVRRIALGLLALAAVAFPSEKFVFHYLFLIPAGSVGLPVWRRSAVMALLYRSAPSLGHRLWLGAGAGLTPRRAFSLRWRYPSSRSVGNL